jgi:hypothetical protein
MSGLLYVFTIVARSIVAAAPLCYNTTVATGGNDTTAATRGSSTTAAAEGGLPNNDKLLLISTNTVKGF